MSYYSRRHDDDWKVGVFMLIIGIVSLFALMLGTNACTSSKWNGGICPRCEAGYHTEVKYELRGVSRHLKYYVCPKCGQEVERY